MFLKNYKFPAISVTKFIVGSLISEKEVRCLRFEDVYKRYYRDYYLLSLSGNPQIAEELTQETFYRAL